MADLSVVTFLLKSLSQLLAKHFSLLHGVEDKVRLLHNQLEIINVFIKSTGGKRNENEMVKVVLNQIRDAANEAEDVIDKFIVSALKHSRRGVVKKWWHRAEYARMLRNVADRIESIKNILKEIDDNKIKYGMEITELPGGNAEAEESSLDRRRRVVEEDDVVGFVDDSNALVKRLIENGPQRDVVSIIGMGGLGKSTLAKKIFNDSRVKCHFDYLGWVYVSQQYRTRELLLAILRGVRPLQLDDFQDRNDEELKRMLFESLRRIKKYLIVLDDVWKTQLWDELGGAFPDDLNGSRILITSRVEDVAKQASTSTSSSTAPSHFLRFLDEKESWELFSKKAFRGGTCPPEMETLGRQIAKSCHGLPLSLVVLGGLLANNEFRLWPSLIGLVNSNIAQEKIDCLDILALSYNHLPQYLKPCFLYFGVYPEDFEIPVRTLLQLWIAEGFIRQNGDGRNLLGIAEVYLEKLIGRSLIQVASWRSDGGVKTCRIHDLLRDLCIRESSNDKFLEVHTHVNQLCESNPRRLSILCRASQYASSSPTCLSSVRSFLCFGKDADLFNTNQWIWLYKSAKLVRVLDLGRVELNPIPDNIGMLIHIKFLKISSKDLKAIPDSICNLWNLETLDMRGSSVEYLPEGLWKLQQLRHLYMSGRPILLGSPKTDGRPLWNLQVISTVAFDNQTSSLLCNDMFPSVTKLGLYTTEFTELKKQTVWESLCRLHHLQRLKIICTSNGPSCPHLFPSTVTKITLAKFPIAQFDCIRILGSLPTLKVLKLREGYENSGMVELNCVAGGFPQLQVLKMIAVEYSKWNLPEDAMPCLQRVAIVACKHLTRLPDELWGLTALKDVEVSYPSSALRTRLQEVTERNGCKLFVYPPSDPRQSLAPISRGLSIHSS